MAEERLIPIQGGATRDGDREEVGVRENEDAERRS